MKFLSVNLAKHVQDFVCSTLKMPMKESKDLNKWRDVPGSWIRKLSRCQLPSRLMSVADTQLLTKF